MKSFGMVEKSLSKEDEIDMGTLEVKLLIMANRIVGKVGESTATNLSVTEEHYVKFGIVTYDLYEHIEAVFEKWIRSYKYFLDYIVEEGSSISENPDLVKTLYWRNKPDVTKLDFEYKMTARLLISHRLPVDQRMGMR